MPEIARDWSSFGASTSWTPISASAETPEIIFCRNVIIYFDRPTQERLLQKLTRQLAPGGYFFVGHSETLHGMDLPLVPVAPAVYRKPR